ncbi:hypothetical protein HOY34_02500 [Xinfangfangia sp. D13-10-4-6]|uniref:hypothetical protein n=1 Tax=Pseudogemmobacter hezensis TaxID=2737662 RepID=UPI0015541DA2|nr:hypothetical protein [Pseudogemmobacter hezensis]NPD14068.1 hypothetical protein [Pseudogemmobacter hezensis]
MLQVMPAASPLRYRDPTLPLWRRAFEWSLVVAAISMIVAALWFLVVRFSPFFGGGPVPKSLNGPRFNTWDLALPFWGLGLYWWIAGVIVMIRAPKIPPTGIRSYYGHRNIGSGYVGRIAIYVLFLPMLAFMLSAVFVSTAIPLVRLAFAGETITQSLRIEKLGTVFDYPVMRRSPTSRPAVRTCYTTIRILAPLKEPSRHCIKGSLYWSLEPGDGLSARFVIHGEFYRMKLSRLAAAEMPENLTLAPALAPFVTQALR